MCVISRRDDYLILEAPELERLMAYLTAKNVAEVSEEGDKLLIKPYSQEIDEALKTACSNDVSSLLLDVVDSLAYSGWLVEYDKYIERIARGDRIDIIDIFLYEYDKRENIINIFTTKPIEDILKQLNFEINKIYKGIIATKTEKSIIRAIEYYEKIVESMK